MSATSDSDRLRILVLAPFPPRLDGSHGGARAIAQLVTRLAKDSPVAVVCLRHEGDRPADTSVRDAVELIVEVPAPAFRAPWTRALRFAAWRAALLAGRPLWVSDAWAPGFRRRVARVAREFDPDVVQFEFSAMTRYAGALKGSSASRVLVEHDPHAAMDRGDGSLIRHLDQRAWRRFRIKALRSVDACVVFTDRDRRTVQASAGATPVVRIGLGAEPVERVAADASDDSLLFVGSFVHAPNVDAAERLATSIRPLVERLHPGTSLYLVGENPPESLLAAGSTVHATGYVPDLRPYLERAAVVAIPLRIGGGMRIKVLEALSAGKAVVASSLAVEGLDVVDGDQLLLAEDDREFAECIAGLLDDPTARRALGDRARAWAQQNLDWRRSVEAYERLYADLAGRGRSASG